MKIKNKIALTLLPLMLVALILINIVFGVYFQRTIDNQENRQIRSAEINIDSYINEQTQNLLAIAYDWGHWDDTYYFINNTNDGFIKANLTESSFYNISLNIMMFVNNENKIVDKRYYSFNNNEFIDFPSGVLDDFSSIMKYSSQNTDVLGIFKLGENFYFLAATNTTDSVETAPINGKIIVARQIDDSIILKMEEISGCSIVSIDLFEASTDSAPADDLVYLRDTHLTDSKEARIIELIRLNSYNYQNSIMLTLSMPREQLLSETRDMSEFAVMNTIACILGSLVILWILNRYLTKPIAQLISDIKTIDINQNEIVRLPESGHNEFSFLRQSINLLLGRIEVDQKSLFDSKEELYATLVSVGDGVIVVDREEKIKFMNPVAQELTGWKTEDALGMTLENVFCILNEYSRTSIESPVKEVFRKDKIIALSNHTVLIAKDGTERAIEDTAAPVKDASGITNGCVLVFKDTSEKKEVNRRIEYLSFHDQLTSLYNRRYFEMQLGKLDHESNLPLSIIYADVNGLKIINDAFGHESGDKIIQKVAEIFDRECRPDDIVARVGGDEFVILLPETKESEVEEIIELLRQQTDQLSYMDIELSISFGWDTKYDESHSVHDVLRNAEDIMYQKKMLSSTSKRNVIIKSILNTLSVKSPREKEHSKRVSSICESIGYAYNLNADDIKELAAAGELHDIGKIAIDEAVLNKASGLSQSEWSQMKHHPEIGFRLLGATNEFNYIAEYVLAHHERWDGTGYPKGLKGDDIIWKARVISIADSYDAMTCDRPYRKGLSAEVAAEEIKKCAGTQFDPEIARVFIEKVLKLAW